MPKGIPKSGINKGWFKKGESHFPEYQFKKGHTVTISEEIRKRIGEKQKGSKNHMWKGGKKKCKGYILILKPKHPFANKQGYVFEHRLIVEKQIGRYLLPNETCHHLGEKTDNRPHMLMAFVSNSAHRRFHGRVSIVKPIFDGRKLSKHTEF